MREKRDLLSCVFFYGHGVTSPSEALMLDKKSYGNSCYGGHATVAFLKNKSGCDPV
jgi:hypothetical protein